MKSVPVQAEEVETKKKEPQAAVAGAKIVPPPPPPSGATEKKIAVPAAPAEPATQETVKENLADKRLSQMGDDQLMDVLSNNF